MLSYNHVGKLSCWAGLKSQVPLRIQREKRFMWWGLHSLPAPYPVYAYPPPSPTRRETEVQARTRSRVAGSCEIQGVKETGLAFWLPQYLANFFFWDSPQEGKELHVLSPSQQLGDGIKLRAVAHVLMYFVDVG